MMTNKDQTKDKETNEATENHSGTILFNHWIESIDHCHKQITILENAYIESVKEAAKQLEENQLTFQQFSEQVTIEQQKWEKKTLEEFLTATAGMQFLFPFQSLEKLNEIIEHAVGTSKSELHASLAGKGDGKSAVSWILKNVELMRKNREQYLSALKKTATSVFEQQQKYVNNVQEQVKQLFFPFQSYIEKHKVN
ncbi:hypothetical protein GN156_09085 [bacterium LRH843]|nr:hypothetical protein [bacterium LRH843]